MEAEASWPSVRTTPSSSAAGTTVSCARRTSPRRAGYKVLVLERRHVLGGAAVTEELHPGFTFSVCSYVVSLFRPHIIRELELARHGWSMIPLESSFTPLPDGDSLCRWTRHEHAARDRALQRPGRRSSIPSSAMAMTKMAQIRQAAHRRARRPTRRRSTRRAHAAAAARQGVPRSRSDLMHLNMQLLTMSAVDFLDLWFESDVLKAPMSVSGIIGTFLGVRSPGTAYVLLHHYMGEIDGAFRSWGFSKGGTGQLSLAIAEGRARVRRRDPHRGAGRARAPDRRRAAEGVVLENGDEIRAKHRRSRGSTRTARSCAGRARSTSTTSS